MYARLLRLVGKTSAGRAIVERVLGKPGTAAIKALKASLTRFGGGNNAVGKDVRMRILRIAWSCNEHAAALQRLDAAGQQRLAGPTSLLISNLVDQLRSPIMTRSPVRLTLLITEAYNAAVGLLQGVLPAEALQDLAVVYATLTDLPFALFFLTSPEAGPERDAFATALEQILQAHIDVAHAAALALHRKLQRQQRTLVQLLHNPRIDDNTRLIVFLRHPVTAEHVHAWLSDAFGEIARHWLAFYASVDSYKQHTGNSTMSAIRAEAIVDVYVRPGGERFLDLPAEVVAEIEAALLAHVFTRRLFARAQAHIYLLANARFAPQPPLSPEPPAAAAAAAAPEAGGDDKGKGKGEAPAPGGFQGSKQMQRLARELEEVTRRLGFFAAVDLEGVKAGRQSLAGGALGSMGGLGVPSGEGETSGEDDGGRRGEGEEEDEGEGDEEDDEDEDDGDVLGDLHGDNTLLSKLGPARVTFWAT